MPMVVAVAAGQCMLSAYSTHEMHDYSNQFVPFGQQVST